MAGGMACPALLIVGWLARYHIMPIIPPRRNIKIGLVKNDANGGAFEVAAQQNSPAWFSERAKRFRGPFVSGGYFSKPINFKAEASGRPRDETVSRH
jgi:hypothetical protein